MSHPDSASPMERAVVTLRHSLEDIEQVHAAAQERVDSAQRDLADVTSDRDRLQSALDGLVVGASRTQRAKPVPVEPPARTKLTSVYVKAPLEPPAPVVDPLPALADSERLNALADTGLLDSLGDSVFDRLARVASAITGAPRSYISLVTDRGQIYPGMIELDRMDQPETRSTDLSGSFCQFAVSTGEPLIVENAQSNALVRDLPGNRDGSIAAYAGIPLKTSGGHVLGTLCVADSKSREWTPSQLQLLSDLTVIATRELEQRIQVEQDQRLKDLASSLARSAQSASSVVASLISRAETLDDTLMQRYAGTSRTRMDQLTALAHEVSAVVAEAMPTSHATETNGVADLGQTVQRAVRSTLAASGSNGIDAQVPEHPLAVSCDPLLLEQSLIHLFITALHHAKEDIPVVVIVRAEHDAATIVVRADGATAPAGELARAVGRVNASSYAGSRDAPAKVSVLRGGVSVEAGTVKANSSPHGLTLTATWPLAVVS